MHGTAPVDFLYRFRTYRMRNQLLRGMVSDAPQPARFLPRGCCNIRLTV
jgi:hypothetical protein